MTDVFFFLLDENYRDHDMEIEKKEKGFICFFNKF